jgi:hypothetical protein
MDPTPNAALPLRKGQPPESEAGGREMTVMRTQISPMLAGSDGNVAIEFSRTAFGAQLLWRLGDEQV